MNKKEFTKLKEAAWRRNLTPIEIAAAQSSPETRPDVEEELALTHLLKRLPDAQVSSNFTAQVIEAANRDSRHRSRGLGSFWKGLKWKPRFAVACLALTIGVVSLTEYRFVRRSQIAQDVATVSSAASLPPQWLEDYDAISRLNQPPVDNELLAALQ